MTLSSGALRPGLVALALATFSTVLVAHEDDLKVITAQFQRIERLARQQGHAIAIGHPREKTLKALKPWLEGIEGKGFQLVPVSALLRLPAAPGAGD